MLSKKVTQWRKRHKCCAFCVHLQKSDGVWTCLAKSKIIHKSWYDFNHLRWPRWFCRLFEVEGGYIEPEEEDNSVSCGEERIW